VTLTPGEWRRGATYPNQSWPLFAVWRQKKYLGLFDTIEKASVAYTRAAKDAFGQFASAR